MKDILLLKVTEYSKIYRYVTKQVGQKISEKYVLGAYTSCLFHRSFQKMSPRYFINENNRLCLVSHPQTIPSLCTVIHKM